jgi:hypothetical protein
MAKVGHDSVNTWLNIWRSTRFQELSIWDDQCELVYSLLLFLEHI